MRRRFLQRHLGSRDVSIINYQLSIRGAPKARSGYVFLITVLLIGTIAAAVVTSLLFLAVNTGRSALTLQQSALAYSYAESCAEIALRALRTNGSYAGDTTETMPGGSCIIRPVQGSGNENRIICTEGISGVTARRMELAISSVIPAVVITSWREVPEITLCPE